MPWQHCHCCEGDRERPMILITIMIMIVDMRLIRLIYMVYTELQDIDKSPTRSSSEAGCLCLSANTDHSFVHKK